MSNKKFTKPKKIDFQEGWENEAAFDGWLVSEEGLMWLAETTGVEIDTETIIQQEKVGKYSADIFARDIDDKVVVIENQLGKTDHSHLGQILTYAGGLTIDTPGCHLIWIAEIIGEEHRAALDWLNSRTDTENNFFGIEVRLFQVGNARFPDFRLVCRPNNWSRAEQKKAAGETTVTKQRHLDIWTHVLGHFRNNNIEMYGNKTPLRDSWLSTGAGAGGCHWRMDFAGEEQNARVSLYFEHKNEAKNQFMFDYMLKHREEVERKFGNKLEWNRGEGVKYCEITFSSPHSKYMDRKDWDILAEWLGDNIVNLKKSFDGLVDKAKKS